MNNESERYQRYHGVPTEDGRFVRPGLPEQREDLDAPRQDDPFRKTAHVPDPRRPNVRKPDMRRLAQGMQPVNPWHASGQPHRSGL